MRKPENYPALPPELAAKRVEDVSKSPASSGKTKMLKYLSGKRLARGEAIVAKCFECMNGYIDGRIDCGVYDCPLYQYMPYRKSKDK